MWIVIVGVTVFWTAFAALITWIFHGPVLLAAGIAAAVVFFMAFLGCALVKIAS